MKLKHYLLIKMSIFFSIQQLHLTGNECFLAQPGDRLGFMQDSEVGSLGYVFQPSTVNSFSTQVITVPNNTLPLINDVITFDTPALPYVFAYSALIDEGRCSISVFIINL